MNTELQTMMTFSRSVHLATVGHRPGQWYLACSGRAVAGCGAQGADLTCKACAKKAAKLEATMIAPFTAGQVVVVAQAVPGNVYAVGEKVTILNVTNDAGRWCIGATGPRGFSFFPAAALTVAQ